MSGCPLLLGPSLLKLSLSRRYESFSSEQNLDIIVLIPMVLNWERFWHSNDAEVHLSMDGFLPDPHESWTQVLNPNIKTLESMDRQCVVLLGEPGMGKSTALSDYTSAHPESLLFDLKDFGSEFSLQQDLFQSPSLLSRLSAVDVTSLCLDSLDEGLLRIDTLGAYLLRQLGKMDFRNLSLRIACRPAVWPNSLGDQLRGLFGDEHFAIFRLCPLREEDVETACASLWINAKEFLKEVRRVKATPLARKPLTLRMLLTIYGRDGALPKTSVELYKEGCMLLCAEVNQSRQEKGRIGALTPGERFAVTERLGALCIFCNRTSIRTDHEVADQSELVGTEASGVEHLLSGEITFEATELREVLDTGLFKGMGTTKAQWDHRTFAEFVAASYCSRHRLNWKELSRLFGVSSATEKRVTPQLSETASWLCVMDADFRSQILRTDPRVLLHSDVNLSEAEKKTLVRAVLDLVQQQPFIEEAFRDNLQAFAYEGLHHQLRPLLMNRSATDRQRRFYMDVAMSCCERELEPEILWIVQDKTGQSGLRAHAAYILATTGSEDAKAQLKPLVSGGDEDPQDEVKGWALTACWPKHMTTAEMLESLTPRKDDHLTGAYSFFLYTLSKSLTEQISDSDLPGALEWTQKQIAHFETYGSRFGEIGDSIILRALAALERSPANARLIADVLASRLESAHTLFSDGKLNSPALLANDLVRRRLLQAFIPKLGEFEPLAFWLFHYGIATSEDLSWLIQLRPGLSPSESELVLALLQRAPRTREALDAVYRAIESNEIPDTFREWLLVEFGSPQMRAARQNYATYLWYTERSRRRRLKKLRPTREERIRVALEKLETADLRWWPQLTRELTLEEFSTHYNDTGAEIETLPGWISADEPVRQRIVDAADAYVSGEFPEPSTFLRTKTFPSSLIAGYQALRLLLRERKSALTQKDSNFWLHWVPLVLWYPFESNEAAKELLELGAPRVPEVLRSTALQLVTKDEVNATHTLDRIRPYWSADIERDLLQAVRNANFKEAWARLVREELLHRGNQDCGAALLRHALTSSQEEDVHSSASAAALLVSGAANPNWPPIFSRVKQEKAFGEAFIEQVVSHPRRTSFVEKLDENQLADLLVWLLTNYPPSEDPQHRGTYSPSLRDEVTDFRNVLPGYLASLGTAAAIQALERARQELHGAQWLEWHILNAKENAIKKAWVPVSPRELLQIVESKYDDSDRKSLVPLWVTVVVSIIGAVGSILIPSSFGQGKKVLIAMAVAGTIVIVFETPRRRKSFMFPLWFILWLCLSLTTAYLILHGT